MIRRLFTVASLMALTFLTVVPIKTTSASSAQKFNPPKQYYLALGDSLAFGFQLAKYQVQLATTGTVNPAVFDTGYVDDFDTMLASLRPRIRVNNYGCPGETTAEVISAPGCPIYRSQLPPYPLLPLHAVYPDPSSSQLVNALAFLRAHQGQVSPITVDIGADDVRNLVSACGGYTTSSLPCIQQHLESTHKNVGKNLGTILGDLRRAAPYSEIIVVQYPNPYAGDQQLDALVRAASDDLAQRLNVIIAGEANVVSARVADAFTPFKPALCQYTGICTPLRDIHPSDAGYAAMAREICNASGYDRFDEDICNINLGQ